ncbi:hypothetical protein [Paenibacillus glacialis]|uniref:Uncharacterized protein n=1 Tax=Paenibacillus glacialis TaxID=494026 RepID=A0A162M337_9BACL|nr:hypothetical protein [Paenibacillus glacialis]OAB37773.1 hypothetical protein PGLA_20590 [Paenibacillus glacialis]
MLEQICIVLGPYDADDLSYEISLGYLVDYNHAMYINGGYLRFRKVRKISDHAHLYTESTEATGIILATGVTREDTIVITEIFQKLKTMNALEFLISKLINLASGDLFLEMEI